MSLLDKASLVVTPNAYKESKLYSVIPSDGSGDMTVVRATTATRVNSANLVEVMPKNFFQYSEQFENAVWSTTSATVSANSTTAPNGTSTADKFIGTAVSGIHNIVQSTDSSSYVFSVYAKAAEETVFSMWVANASKRAEFNLATGTIGLSTVANSTITNVGNGWYRCSVYDPSATITYRIYGRTGGVYTGNGVDGMFFWGAQINEGTTATEYFPTTTRLNIPRIDYTNGSCPSLLVEPQRTNIILNSQNFAAVSWTPVATTITANAGISPDGTNNANKFIPSTVATSHYIAQLFTSSTSGSISVYAKADGYNNITLLTSNTNVNYNLSTGTVQAVGGVGTGAIQSVGNGWYRCILYKVLTTETLYISCGSNTNAGFFNGSGNGTSGVLIWGGQVEVGAYATSYIPTVASSVTRNADSISKTGISSLINSPEGVLYFEGSSIANDGVGKAITLLANTSNFIKLLYSSTLNRVDFVCISAGSVSCNIVKVITDTTANNKIALKWKNNNFALWINGVNQGTDTSGNAPLSLSTLSFTNEGGGELFAGKMKNLIVFPTALSDTELAQLTTI
jgi:hypothetical protein